MESILNVFLGESNPSNHVLELSDGWCMQNVAKIHLTPEKICIVVKHENSILLILCVFYNHEKCFKRLFGQKYPY